MFEAIASAHLQNSYDEEAAEQKAEQMLDKQRCKGRAVWAEQIVDATHAIKAERARMKQERPRKKGQKARDKKKRKAKLAKKKKEVKELLKLNAQEVADTAIAKFKA